jgi:hypothetical protein
MIQLEFVHDYQGSQRICGRKVAPMTDRIWVERAEATNHASVALLEELLTFERLLADLSARVANVPGDYVET